MFEIVKDAFKTAFKKPLTYFALIGVPVVVCCFGLLYFSTFMNPYERMKDLPVAIINEDAGCTVDNEEKNYGDELVDSILETDSVKWVQENAELYESGLENSDYFMAVVIPSDFSEKVSAGETRNPEQADIIFYKNVRKNYMLSTMSSKIESALREKVNNKITEQYATAYLKGLEDAGEGFGDAADGAGELAEGLDTASDAADKLSSGASSLSDGMDSLQDGITTLADGLSTLNASSESLTSGSTQVKEGIEKLADGSKTYAQTLSDKQSELAEPFGGDPTDATTALKEQYAKALQEYATNIVIAAKTGQNPSDVDSSAVTTAVTALAQASSAAGAYQALGTAADGFSSLEEGGETLSNSYSGLDEGISTYTDAVSQLAAGAESAQEGAETLANGASKLESGTKSLEDGLESAKDGANTLSDSLSEGQQTIDDAMTASVEDTASYIADPVDVSDDAYGDLDSFGYGFAPLFLSLCLWLGSLMIFFVFDAFPSRKYLGASRFRVIFGRWPLYAILSALNATAACAGALALGLPTTNFNLLVLLFVVDAFVFLCILQLLNLFDTAGKALSVLLIIFQIVCCSGTLPAVLGSDFAQTLGPWLPFYYSIDAFREIMSGGMTDVVLHDMSMLLVYAVIAVALSLLTYPIALKAKLRRDRDTLRELSGQDITSSSDARSGKRQARHQRPQAQLQ